MKLVNKNAHFLLMAAGCVLMLVAGFALTTATSGGSWGFYLLLLFCPAMHYLIHRGMRGRKNRHEMPYAQLPTSGKGPSGEEQSRPSE
jgi:hypothetical protein